MNRLTYALRVLFNGIPAKETVEVVKEVEVIKEVPGKAFEVQVYEAGYDDSLGFGHKWRRSLGRYLTCEQAHSAHPGADVRRVTAYRFGRRYFVIEGMREVMVEKAAAK